MICGSSVVGCTMLKVAPGKYFTKICSGRSAATKAFRIPSCCSFVRSDGRCNPNLGSSGGKSAPRAAAVNSAAANMTDAVTECRGCTRRSELLDAPAHLLDQLPQEDIVAPYLCQGFQSRGGLLG